MKANLENYAVHCRLAVPFPSTLRDAFVTSGQGQGCRQVFPDSWPLIQGIDIKTREIATWQENFIKSKAIEEIRICHKRAAGHKTD